MEETALTDSILLTVKRCLDIEDDYDAFDAPILTHINTYLHVLWMQGVGKSNFKVTGPSETWSDLLGDDADHLQMAATYISTRVKLIFDPPQNSSLYNAYKEEANELGWYLGVESDILESEVDYDAED